MRRLIRQPAAWLAAFMLWFATLWWLSSRVAHFPPALDFRLSDKLLHFGYFFAGGILLAAFLYRRRPQQADWRKIILFATTIVALIGALDEWHQSKVPGRSGNDPGDFSADLLGALSGTLALRFARRLID